MSGGDQGYKDVLVHCDKVIKVTIQLHCSEMTESVINWQNPPERRMLLQQLQDTDFSKSRTTVERALIIIKGSII